MLLIFFGLILLTLLALVFCSHDRNLDRQILSVLLRYGEMYGLQIIEAIEQDFGKEPGGLVYGCLRRLEREGFITARWREEKPPEREGARRRYYRLSGKRFRLEDSNSTEVDLPFVLPANIYPRC